MMIKAKAFARFREAFGNERGVELDGKAAVTDLLTGLCAPHGSHDLIFGEYDQEVCEHSGKRKAYPVLKRDPDRISRWRRGCDSPSDGRWLG